MILVRGATLPLLPDGEKAGMRGIGDRAESRLSGPLTLPSPHWEGK